MRLTIDCRKLNEFIDLKNYSLPKIEDIINKLHNKEYFSVIDLKDGFHQIKINTKDSYKTAFRFKHKTYEWLRLPMGFKNSPIIFQWIMNDILKDELENKCLVYLDDIVIFGKDMIEHDRNLEDVCTRLNQFNVKVNKKKWTYKKKKKILGYEIEKNRYRIINEKRQKIEFLEQPKSKKQVQKLLGFINYFRKSVENLSSLCTPLYHLLNKNVKFKWGDEENETLKKIKKKINESSYLTIPDPNQEFILYTDASNNGVGAVLMQKKTDGIEYIIEYASRALTKAEKNYGITEKESLALIWGIQYFQHYLRGKRFIIKTDHKALIYIKNKR